MGIQACIFILRRWIRRIHTDTVHTYQVLYTISRPLPTTVPILEKRKKVKGGVVKLICNPFVFLFFTLIPNMGVWVSPLYIYRDLDGYAPQNRGLPKKRWSQNKYYGKLKNG